MDKQQISYFDTTKKLLQNLENCTNKEIDSPFIKEALKSIISIMKTQNSFIEYLVEIDEHMEIVSSDKQILPGMLCYIRQKKCFGKISEVDEENELYILTVLDTNEELKISKKQFNI